MLDHVAVATRSLPDGWELFARLLGGRWAYGGDSPGFWWGQLRFAAGAKIELLTPTGGPHSAFLERFLTTRGAGPHHFNFIVPDIVEALGRVRALGIEPVQVNLDHPNWKEAFLHPKNAFGIVVQIAQQGTEPAASAPKDLPDSGPTTTFSMAEHHVDDLDAALRLFSEALDGQRMDDESDPDAAMLQWTNGARLRLERRSTESSRASAFDGGLHHLEFKRAGKPVTPAERDEIDVLATRLGVSIHLSAGSNPQA